MLRLLITHGPEIQEFPLPAEAATLGSAPENDIVVAARGVSHRHAFVRRAPGGVEIEDRGSKNGVRVEGQRLKRTLLTPGLSAQLGEVWIEVEEISSSAARLSAEMSSLLAEPGPPSRTATSPEAPVPDSLSSSPAAAFQLVYHLRLAKEHAPVERRALFARSRRALGAELLASFRLRRRRAVEVLEQDGPPLLRGEEDALSALARGAPSYSVAEVRLKRAAGILLAVRGSYGLAAKFTDPSHAREGWRRDFLRFLAVCLLAPAESLREATLDEIQRVLAATGGNKSETARLLGITRQALYDALKRAGLAGTTRSD